MSEIAVLFLKTQAQRLATRNPHQFYPKNIHFGIEIKKRNANSSKNQQKYSYANKL